MNSLNDQYLKDMEKNSKIFDQKLSIFFKNNQNNITNDNNEKIIQQLKNEIEYKDNLINELNAKLESKSEIENQLHQLINEINKLKEENKKLKQTINDNKRQYKNYNNKEEDNNIIESPSEYNNINISEKRKEEYKNKNKNHFDGFNYFPCEHGIYKNKEEILELDTSLVNLLKEKQNIENELFKYPDRPRNLNEMKAKKAKNETIEEIENKINKIKLRIRQLNNNK